MNADQFLDRVSASFDAPWLAAAVAAVDESMDGDGGHDFGHLFRVFANALHIVERDDPEADLDAVVAAIIFHDVVNLPKNHPERRTASTRSAEFAVKFFEEIPDHPDLELVAEAIRCHSWSAGLTPVSFEAQVVADADNLEAIGAFGIARTFYVAGRMGSSIVDTFDPDGDHRELDDRRYAVDHFAVKLLKLKEQMHTPTGRAMAAQRHQFMVGFLEQLRAEIDV